MGTQSNFNLKYISKSFGEWFQKGLLGHTIAL